MKYYKLIVNGKIVDVLEGATWVAPGRNGFPMVCGAAEACGVVSSNGSSIYHIEGTPEMTDAEYNTATVLDTTEDEYKRLYDLLGLGADVREDTDGIVIEEVQEPEETADPRDEENLETVRKLVLDKMSEACEQAIYSGVDVQMTSGETKHFSLTIEDQINLITMSTMLATGSEYVPYHADGELCTMYSAEDMQRIINAAMDYKIFYTTYFNCLKNYIMSLTDISTLCAIRFGDTFPEEFWSDVMKGMVKG